MTHIDTESDIESESVDSDSQSDVIPDLEGPETSSESEPDHAEEARILCVNNKELIKAAVIAAVANGVTGLEDLVVEAVTVLEPQIQNEDVLIEAAEYLRRVISDNMTVVARHVPPTAKVGPAMVDEEDVAEAERALSLLSPPNAVSEGAKAVIFGIDVLPGKDDNTWCVKTLDLYGNVKEFSLPKNKAKVLAADIAAAHGLDTGSAYLQWLTPGGAKPVSPARRSLESSKAKDRMILLGWRV